MSQTTTPPVAAPRHFSKKPRTSYAQPDLGMRQADLVNAIRAFAEDPAIKTLIQDHAKPHDQADNTSPLYRAKDIIDRLAHSETSERELLAFISEGLRDFAARDPLNEQITDRNVRDFLLAANPSGNANPLRHIKHFGEYLRHAATLETPGVKTTVDTLHEAAERSGLLVAIDHLLKAPEPTRAI